MAAEKKKRRIWEIDVLRGICILLMVFDHTMFDFAELPYWTSNFFRVGNETIEKLSMFAIDYWSHPIRMAVRMAVVFLFLLLSGISCNLSRSNGKRLVKLVAASVILTVVTLLADRFFDLGVSIIFGILHILAFNVLIYILMRLLWNNKYFYLIIGAVIIVGGILIDFMNIPMRDEINFQFFLESVVGTSYYGADCYGVLPYTGVFLVGAYLGETLYFDRTSLMPYLDNLFVRPLAVAGRNTIFIYLLHQPLILGIIYLIATHYGYVFG